MTEQEWRACQDFSRMLRFMTEDDGFIGHAGVRMATPRQLKMLVYAIVGREQADNWELADHPNTPGLWLDGWIRGMAGQPQAPAEFVRALLVLRDIVGNPFRPVTLPGALPKRHCQSCQALMTMTANHQHGLGLWHCSANKQHVTRAVTLEEMRLHKQGGCPWITPTVLSLAHAAYEERPGQCRLCKGKRFIDRPVICGPDTTEGEMRRIADEAGGPIPCPSCRNRIDDGRLDPVTLLAVADALEEAGCGDTEEKCHRCKGKDYFAEGDRMSDMFPSVCPTCGREPHQKGGGMVRIPNPVLTHLRSPGPHARGCWAVDLLLGKE